jgi:hypothetical protein
MTTAANQKPVAEFAEELADAYSTDRYRNGWSASIKMMRRRGYTDAEINAVIRSKHTRWAGDSVSKNDNVTSTDLARYLNKNMNPKELAQLVAETPYEENA